MSARGRAACGLVGTFGSAAMKPFDNPRALQDLAVCCLRNAARCGRAGARGPSRPGRPHKTPARVSRRTSVLPAIPQRAGFFKRLGAKSCNARHSSNVRRPKPATRGIPQTGEVAVAGPWQGRGGHRARSRLQTVRLDGNLVPCDIRCALRTKALPLLAVPTNTVDKLEFLVEMLTQLPSASGFFASQAEPREA